MTAVFVGDVTNAKFELMSSKYFSAFSALTLLVRRQEGHPACKKTARWDAGVVICLERGADLHTAQLMPLSLTVSCFTKTQIGVTFLVPAHLGSPGKRTVKRVLLLCCCHQNTECCLSTEGNWAIPDFQ